MYLNKGTKNPNVPIRKALDDIVDDLKTAPRYNGVAGNIGEDDEPVPVGFDELTEKVESANRIEHIPQIPETELRENLSEEPTGRVREMRSESVQYPDRPKERPSRREKLERMQSSVNGVEKSDVKKEMGKEAAI